MTAIHIDALCKTYRGKKKTEVEALKELSLAVKPGEVFGFLGPNGAGKSTTIKILTGQIQPSCGTARILGVSVTSPLARRQVGYLPENPAFYEFLTAREYLWLVGRAFSMDAGDLHKATERVLSLLELDAAARRPIRGFSKGMVQRLGLAQVLLHDPQVCILDEPMSGLDPMGRALVKQIVGELREQGKTVFFSSHITADVEAVCDRVGVINKGRLETVVDVKEVLRAGLNGYLVQVRNGTGVTLLGFAGTDRGHGICEYDVAPHRLQEFMDLAGRHRSEIILVEPRRKDMEAFFLDIVAGAPK